MKKILLFAVIFLCGVVSSESFAKKPKKQEKTEAEMKATLDSLKILYEQHTKELEKEFEQLKAGPQPALPCEDAVINDEDYYGALGISNPLPSHQMAIQDARQKAKSKLVEQVAGEEIEMSNVEMVCQRVSRDKQNYYIAYVALKVKKTDIKIINGVSRKATSE